MYENLNFREWPFRTVPDDEFAGVWAGRPKTKQQLDRLLRKMQMVPKSGFHVLWANFGMGKTHTLLHLKHLCQQTDGMLIPIFAVMPKRSTGFIELYREIVQALPFNYLGDQLIKVSSTVGGNVGLHPMFEKAPGVVRALLAIRSGDLEKTTLARQWLSGKPGMTKSEMKYIEVSYRIRMPEDAINALDALTDLAVFSGGGRKKLVIMIDEYQRIGELRAKAMNENNASLHGFFNNHPIGLELILSFSFGKKSNLDFMLSSELKSRAEPQSIMLDILSQTDAIEFLKDLLTQFRIKENSENWAYPFTPEALESIVAYIEERKALTPRRVMLYTNHVLLEYLLDQDPEPSGICFEEISKYLENPDLGASDTDSPQD